MLHILSCYRYYSGERYVEFLRIPGNLRTTRPAYVLQTCTFNIQMTLCLWERKRKMLKRQCVCVCDSCYSERFICSFTPAARFATCRERGARQSISLLITFTHRGTLQLMVTGRSEHEQRGRNEREGLSRWVWRDLDLKQLEEKRGRRGRKRRRGVGWEEGSKGVRWMTHRACKCLTVPCWC